MAHPLCATNNKSMSDSYITIVPNLIDNSQSETIAQSVIDYLQGKQIIQSIRTDCTLGGDGFAPGKNYRSVLVDKQYDIQNFSISGLEIITTRTVFHNGENGLDSITCPNCRSNVIDANWAEAVDEWFNNTGKKQFTCIYSRSVESITNYKFFPTWGFGVLGFKFWNWPSFKKQFISSIELIVNKEVK